MSPTLRFECGEHTGGERVVISEKIGDNGMTSRYYYWLDSASSHHQIVNANLFSKMRRIAARHNTSSSEILKRLVSGETIDY